VLQFIHCFFAVTGNENIIYINQKGNERSGRTLEKERIISLGLSKTQLTDQGSGEFRKPLSGSLFQTTNGLIQPAYKLPLTMKTRGRATYTSSLRSP